MSVHRETTKRIAVAWLPAVPPEATGRAMFRVSCRHAPCRPTRRPGQPDISALLQKPGFLIIPERPRMDRHHGLARHHVLFPKGHQRGMQAAEVGQILQ